MHFNRKIIIGNQIISDDSSTFIIGEAGVNHNGSIETAKELVDCAVNAGVDAVKFQMFRTDDLILKSIEKALYQKETTIANQTQYEMLKSLELPEETFKSIMDYCDEKGILFLCTPFEKRSLDKLDELGIKAYKIAATDITNVHFLKQVAEKGKPIILSAGMCYLEEIRIALQTICPINKDVILLQCTANYPLQDNEVNLNVIDTLKNEFDIIVGFSDHSVGIGASPYAVCKGAKVIEKHFTLDKNMTGPDHRASVEPDNLIRLVKDIRRVETYMGSRIKTPTFSEQFTRKSLQKCIVASEEIDQGECFSENNISTKRTGGEGISALYYESLIGQQSDKKYNPDDIITISKVV